MRHFCTLFDVNYLTRGLALYDSLRKTCSDFRLTILCLDASTIEILTRMNLLQAECVPISQLEAWDPELARVRSERSKVEYYFTCKPALMSYVMETGRDVRRITYLDSDLYFFADPALLDKEISGSSVALTPHRFTRRLADRAQFGEYNAGWVSAAVDGEGRRFLEWWRRQCYEWCKFVVEGPRFADQKYLDAVPKLFRDVCIMRHPGANLAPWNVADHVFRAQGQGERVCVDGEPIVFFHFHNLKPILWRLYDSGLLPYGVELSGILRERIYRPYLATVTRCDAAVRESCGATHEANGRRVMPGASRKGSMITSIRSLKDNLRLTYRVLRSNTAVMAP